VDSRCGSETKVGSVSLVLNSHMQSDMLCIGDVDG
jgi:hypothetical protein